MPAPAARPVRRRSWLAVGAVEALLLAVAVLAFGGPLQAQAASGAAGGARVDTVGARLPVPRPADHGMADFRWVLRTLDDRVVQLEDYRGRVLFVNLWATWCPPCIEELASIQALAGAARAGGALREASRCHRARVS